MQKHFKIFTGPALFFSIFGVLFAAASFFIVFDNSWGYGSYTIFLGSIATTVSAILSPIFSIEKLNFNSYKIKIYSLTIGLICSVAMLIMLLNKISFAQEILNYSKNGLIWGINTALLLFNLATLEVENNNLKNQDLKKKLEEKDKVIKESKQKILALLKEKKEKNEE